MSAFDEPPPSFTSSFRRINHAPPHNTNTTQNSFIRRPKPIGSTRGSVSVTIDNRRTNNVSSSRIPPLNRNYSDSHKENTNNYHNHHHHQNGRRRNPHHKGRDPPPPPPPSSSGLTPPKLFQSEWDKFDSKRSLVSSNGSSKSLSLSADDEWTEEPSFEQQQQQQQHHHRTLERSSSSSTTNNAAIERRKARRGMGLAPLERISPRKSQLEKKSFLPIAEPVAGTTRPLHHRHQRPTTATTTTSRSSTSNNSYPPNNKNGGPADDNIPNFSSVPTRQGRRSNTSSSRILPSSPSPMDNHAADDIHTSFSSVPTHSRALSSSSSHSYNDLNRSYASAPAATTVHKSRMVRSTSATSKKSHGPVDLDDIIDDASSSSSSSNEEEEEQCSRRTSGPVDIDEIDDTDFSSSDDDDDDGRRSRVSHDAASRVSHDAASRVSHRSRMSRVSQRVDLDDGAILDNTATPTNVVPRPQPYQQTMERRSVVDPQQPDSMPIVPARVITPPSSPIASTLRTSCNVSPLTVGGRDDFAPRLVVANGTKRRGGSTTNNRMTSHGSVSAGSRRSSYSNSNSNSTAGASSSSSTTTRGTGSSNSHSARLPQEKDTISQDAATAAAAAALVASTLENRYGGGGGGGTTKHHQKSYRKHAHFTFLDNSSQEVDIPRDMLERGGGADTSSVVSSNVSSVSGTTAASFCDNISHSSAGTTSVYPVKEDAYLHAQKAGVVWQSIVGRHVKFPESWWGGSRTPSMGVNEVDNAPLPPLVGNNGGEQQPPQQLIPEKIPEYPWRYIALDPFYHNDVLDDFVPTKKSSGRLILHIVITDASTWKPVQDVAIGCYHPFHRDLVSVSEKGRNIRALWMALRRRSGYVLGCTALVDPLLMSECNVCDIEMASPLGRRRRLRNNHLRAVFGDMPPEETIFISETDLVAKIKNARNLETFEVRTDIKLLLLEMFLRRTVEV